MSALFEELDYQPTSLGPISLRRRHDLRLKVDILEIMLGDEHLMSDLFTTSEIALATLGLAYHRNDAQHPDRDLDIVVGGLGLGYTAAAVLDDIKVGSLRVVEALQPIINWHESGLLPLGPELCNDPRCHFVLADFFASAAAGVGFDEGSPARAYDAILVDIDHAPDFHLSPDNAGFYTKGGLADLRSHLREGGVFGLWSNDPPDDGFVHHLASVFTDACAEPVIFANPYQHTANPYQHTDVTQTIYLARR